MNRLIATIGIAACACSLASTATSRERKPPTVYANPDSPGQVRGVGTESQDIVSMSDQMVRDLLTVPKLLNAAVTPRVIIDAAAFRNESSEIIDKALITDRIRVNLNRASQGRIRFVGREYADVVQMERDLKRSGNVDSGTTGRTAAMAGADYRMVGRIGTRDAIDPRTGVRSRYSMYTFELLDLEYGDIVWSSLYEFKKETQDNVVYR